MINELATLEETPQERRYGNKQKPSNAGAAGRRLANAVFAAGSPATIATHPLVRITAG